MPAVDEERVARLAGWLRCPVCADDLAPVDRLTVGCRNGHRHDVNKRGYISLLGGGSKHLADTAEMLDARDAVLGSGVYSPISEAVASAATSGGVQSDADAVLDAGSGTGHYLRAVLAALPAATGLAMDLSPAAVARAVRRTDGLQGRVEGLVADTWRPLPVRTARADIVLDVFAPRNLPEFHRVLRSGGSLIVVVPRADHLAELRATGTMLDVPTDKADDLIAAAEPLYALLTREHVRAQVALDGGLGASLVAMGPSARHVAQHPEDGLGAMAVVPDSTHLSVDVLHFASRS